MREKLQVVPFHGKIELPPVFPGVTSRIHWSIEDPSSFEGNYEEKLEKTHETRDAIKAKLKSFIKTTI